MAFRHYVEAFDGWVCPDADSDDQWIAHDLLQYGVPPNAVVEIAIGNPRSNIEYWAGVRKTGSSLDRRILIAESEGAGEHLYTVLVQADASGNIEYYSDYFDTVFPSTLYAPNFYVVGWWVGCNYVEKFENFAPASPSGWEGYSLDQYGASGSQIVDITMSNDSENTGYEMGVRTSGSILERKVRIKEAEGGGKVCLTLSVLASGDTAAIDLYADNTTECLFYLLGYFTTPPGDYIEQFLLFSNPTIDWEWQSLDTGVSGVPNNATVQFAMGHAINAGNTKLGVRQTSSALERIVNLDESETDGTTPGTNWGGMCSRTDSSGYLEYMSADVSDDPDFIAVGYWTNFTNSDAGFPYVGSINCFIEGSPTAQCDLYISGPNEIFGSGNLFLKAPEPFSASGILFISGIPGFISTSGQYPSGVPFHIYGVQLANIDLYTHGSDQHESSGNLYIHGANICRTDADFSVDYPSGLFCYTQGSGIIPESGQCHLVVTGMDIHQASGDLFINAHNIQSGSNDLFINGYEPFNTSGNHPSGMPLRIGDGHEALDDSCSLFTAGPLPHSGEIHLYTQAGVFEPPLDLFTLGNAPYSGSIDGFIWGHLDCNSSCDLYIGPLRSWDNWILYLKTEDDDINDTTNLFIHGFTPPSGSSGVNQTFNNIGLYLEAADADYPYTAGGTESWTLFLKAPSGNLTDNEAWTMFLKADFTTPANCNLYTYGHASGEQPRGNEINDSIGLICSVNPDDPSRIGYTPINSDTDPWTLFLKCTPGHFGTANLYISGAAPIHTFASGSLFIEGLFEQETGTAQLYLMGVLGITNSGLNLFLDATTLVYNTRGNLYLHGY